MAQRPFLGKGIPESEREALIRSGVFDGDLFQAVRSKDWRRKYTTAEIERMKLLETQEIGIDWSYRGNLWDFYNILRDRAVIAYWDRQFRTGQNLTDLVGTAAYGLGEALGADPAQASDVGATLGSVISAGVSGPRFSPPAPIYQRNPPTQTVGGRGVTLGQPSSTAKNAPPPVSAPVTSGRPQASQRGDQRPPSASPGSREVDNRIEGRPSLDSRGSKVPESPRTGEPDPLGMKKPAFPVAPPSAPSSESDTPSRKPKRFNARDLLPPKPDASKTEPQKYAEGSEEETKPTAGPAKSQASKPGLKGKRAERIPSGREVEKGTIGAIKRDEHLMPVGSQVVSKGQTFNTIAKLLTAIREKAPNSTSLEPLGRLRREVLSDNAWQLMDRQARAGRPELKDVYIRLYKLAELRAKRGDPTLKDELDEFMKSGLLGARKPDSVVLVDEGTAITLVSTDPTVKSAPVALMVHDFKSLFYNEGLRALCGNDPNVKVESWEHIPTQGIHRQAQGGTILPPY